MNVTLFGATGKVGRPILRELINRGHTPVAVARDPKDLAEEFDGVEVRSGDLFDPVFLAIALEGADALISSVALRDPAQADRTPVALTRSIAEVAAAKGLRWVSLGGAGSLQVEPGLDFVDSPGFPAVAAKESLGFREALHELQDNAPAGLDWTVVSPPIEIVHDATRTGSYRSGGDVMLRDDAGRSWISVEDLAVAAVDQLESTGHRRQRVSVAY